MIFSLAWGCDEGVGLPKTGITSQAGDVLPYQKKWKKSWSSKPVMGWNTF